MRTRIRTIIVIATFRIISFFAIAIYVFLFSIYSCQ